MRSFSKQNFFHLMLQWKPLELVSTEKDLRVVKEEVGRLAQISGKSAEEINKLLQESVGKVQTIIAGNEERIIMALGEGNEKIIKGSKVIQDCNDSLIKITDSIRTVSHRIDEIAQASREQGFRCHRN